MNHQLNEFKILDKEEQAEIRDRATAQLEKVGERPLKYMLAYLSAQRMHFLEEATTEAYSRPSNDAISAYNAGKLAGRMSAIETLLAGVNGELDGKDTAASEETGPSEEARFNETTSGGTTTGDGF